MEFAGVGLMPLLLVILLFQVQVVFAGTPSCAGLFAGSLSSFPSAFINRIKLHRPDIYRALLERKEKHLHSIPLDERFVREPLKKYFPRKEAFEPVVLYRGIDRDSFLYNFIGEKRLVWTSLNKSDAMEYAAQGLNRTAKQVLILKIIVPKFMVYERSSWPVLRWEDVPDLQPFVEGASPLFAYHCVKRSGRQKVGWHPDSI